MKKFDRERAKRVRRGEGSEEDQKRGTQRLQQLNNSVGLGVANQLQLAAGMGAPAQGLAAAAPKPDPTPVAYRFEKREALPPGIGEKYYEIA